MRLPFSRLVVALALALLSMAPLAAAASSVSHFQARLAQTLWNAQALEGMVKGQRASSRPVPTPEAIDSFLLLLRENVAALTASAADRWTDEQRRLVTEGIRSVATQLRDLAAVSSHRGLTTVSSEVSRLEASCRLALPDGN